MSKLHVTCIQSKLHWQDKEANLKMFEEKIRAIEGYTEIVVLPEMFSTGFSMDPETYAETMDGPTVSWMKKQSAEKPQAQRKEDTKALSYALHKEGNSIVEIASLRNLAVSTIESHLAYYIQRGMISVNELVKTEKIILIEPVLENFEGNSITPIKQKLGNAVSFGEIKMVLASKEWQRISNDAASLDT